jgi:hypothetical protein
VGAVRKRAFRGEVGRVSPLRPGGSDVDLFCYGEGIVDLNAQILTVLSILV